MIKDMIGQTPALEAWRGTGGAERVLVVGWVDAGRLVPPRGGRALCPVVVSLDRPASVAEVLDGEETLDITGPAAPSGRRS